MNKIIANFEDLKQINGYLGAGIFDHTGKMIAGVLEVSGLNFEIAGGLLQKMQEHVKKLIEKAGFGSTAMIQLETQIGIILFKDINLREGCCSLVLVMKKDGNIGYAKIKLNQVAENLTKAL